MTGKPVIPPEMIVAGTRLQVPPGVDVYIASDLQYVEKIEDFLKSSPDFTIYHTPKYLEAVARHDAPSDLILLASNGRPLVAFPCIRKGYQLLSTGYSGLVFPDTAKESRLRASVSALGSFIAANPSVRFGFLQSLQSRAYQDPLRVAVIDALLTELPLASPPLFSRSLNLLGVSLPSVDGDLGADDFENELLHRYDPDTRNQIRKALRLGFRADYFLGDAGAIDRYHEIHRESWRRTGMKPMSRTHLKDLSAAVVAAGGQDLIVLVSSAVGEVVAAVSVHVFGARAIYWGGCSTVAGLRANANSLALHAAITLSGGLGAACFEIGWFEPQTPNVKMAAINRYKASFRGGITRLVRYRSPDSRWHRLVDRGQAMRAGFERRWSRLRGITKFDE